MQPSQKKNVNNHCHRYQQKSVEIWKYVRTYIYAHVYVCMYGWMDVCSTESAVGSAGQQKEHKY